jgi:hypothetical protein
MNFAEGMSNEEIDFWADLFYQAKISGVIEVTFSQFISEPFTHLGAASASPNPTANKVWCWSSLSQQPEDSQKQPPRGV